MYLHFANHIHIHIILILPNKTVIIFATVFWMIGIGLHMPISKCPLLKQKGFKS